MKHCRNSVLDNMLTTQAPPRVALVGDGIAELTCALNFCPRGCHPVVFETDIRLSNRCRSRSTLIEMFDDVAQCISGANRLAALAMQRPVELAAIHPSTLAATLAEDESNGRDCKKDEDEAYVTRTLNLMGVVGVPSMLARADPLERPLDVPPNTTPILQARRRGARLIQCGTVGEIKEDFQTLAIAIPTPLAMPLVRESSELPDALPAVRHSSRRLLFESEYSVPLPGYREFQGSPSERVAAIHSKPGRRVIGLQYWFVEVDELWFFQHKHDGAEIVADLLLDNFREHAGRSVKLKYLDAQQWRHVFVETPATTPKRTECLWDENIRLSICGDRFVASQVDRVHGSGVEMALAVTEGLTTRGGRSDFSTVDRNLGQLLEAQF